MRYTLLVHYNEVSAEELGPEVLKQGQRAFAAYAETLHAAGVLIGAEVLQPSASTTTVTTVDGQIEIQDGPYADTKEQLGGHLRDRRARPGRRDAGGRSRRRRWPGARWRSGRAPCTRSTGRWTPNR